MRGTTNALNKVEYNGADRVVLSVGDTEVGENGGYVYIYIQETGVCYFQLIVGEAIVGYESARTPWEHRTVYCVPNSTIRLISISGTAECALNRLK